MNSKRRKSVTIETVESVTKRRFSYQPSKANLVTLRPPKDPVCFDNFFKINFIFKRGGKSMRRLSEIITDWERPSRSSLGQLYSFARRESVYIARKKLAGLKDWALDLLAKLKSKQGMAIRRETRATKLVATVMGIILKEFLKTLNIFRRFPDLLVSIVISLFFISSQILFSGTLMDRFCSF